MFTPDRMTAVSVAFALWACAGDDAGPPAPLVVELPPVQVGAFEETDALCQSYTLGNQESLFVNAVAMRNDGGFHHSNWFFVPESVFAGPDGTWNCAERNFDQLTAVVSGGVFAAQSTQTSDEVLGFVDGAAYEIPPGSKLVGNLHLLNATDAPLETAIRFEVRLLAADEVDTRLSPMSIEYHSLDIPPMTRSRFTATCDIERSYGRPIDFRFYYMLPHYHALGYGVRFAALDSQGGADVIYEKSASAGEVLSATLDPPYQPEGAVGLELSCDFINPRDQSVGWGIGDQEMCILVAWTDSELTWYGGVTGDNRVIGVEDGVTLNTGDCQVLFLAN